MRIARRRLVFVVLSLCVSSPAVAQALRVAVLDSRQAAEWDARIARMLRAGELAVRRTSPDTLIPGREHQRMVQLHSGVPVFGGELVRQTDGSRTLSLFGTLYGGIDVDPRPTLTPDQVTSIVGRLSGADIGPLRVPDLMVLPRDGGGYALVFRLRAATETDITVYFIDARTGEVVLQYSDLETQAAVGLGSGVLGDQKKMSVLAQGGAFLASDELRPPALLTFDMKGDLLKAIRFLNGVVDLATSDLARDADNNWTDTPVVDGHSYAGWTYDYYFKRFGRRGLDNRDLAILSLIHPVRREDFFLYSSGIRSLFYTNAFYAGDGIMVYGEGLPTNLRRSNGQYVDFLAGALDVVSHELTHGVTDYTSGLIYRNESGALNESFSDMMATGAEFFFFPAGSGPFKADYLLGEDVFTPGGIRSLQNPVAYGDPDHYSLRFTGTADNGGVHTNSGIPNHVFYLSIEGGRNRVSGITVTGVGGANREQIEKLFYRAFTLMLPASADFSTARAATIQSARDLFGASSAAVSAVTQAWNAVGVS